jgi:hypothetical protein
MNSDHSTEKISLNLVAICIFGITISSLVAPLVNISATIPILAIAAVIVGATIDNFFFKSILATLTLDAIESRQPAYRQRIIQHEAGHFLVAYLLGIVITGYTLSAWESFQQGRSAQGGVIFSPPGADVSAQQLQNYYTVWMAGIAAEKLMYDRSTGGSEDRQKLRGVMFLTGKQQQEVVRQENQATLAAKNLINSQWQAYQALAAAMGDHLSVADCCREIDLNLVKN